MIQKAIGILAAVALLATGLPQVQAQQTAKPSQEALNLQESFSRVAGAIEPAVVNISTLIEEQVPQNEFFFGSPFEEFFGQGEQGQSRRPRTRRAEGVASGVIISADGYILTNEHVVRGAREIQVTLFDQRKFKGSLVGKDERTDIAVIRIRSPQKLQFARLGDSENIKVGDWVIAVGYPFGLSETVTAGIVSAKKQSLSIEGTSYNNMIQTDAAINRGNSGGPLCNINAEVIGINTAIYAPTGVFAGIGFAIPINSAKSILDSLIQKGKVVRGWLGVETQPVDAAIARQFGLPDTTGVLVAGILPNSPAAAAGLQRGDVIRGVNGQRIASPQELQAVISRTPPKKAVTLQIVRARKTMDLRLTTGEMPSQEELAQREQGGGQQGEVPVAEWEGMQVATLTADIAQQSGLPEGAKGCVVVGVGRGSAAEAMGLEPGDLIRSVNQMPTPTIKEFKAATARVKLAEGVVLDVNRQGRELYLSFSATK